MIKFDFSSVKMSSNAFTYLVAFVPGLFFEISVLLANPGLVKGIVHNVLQAYSFGYYAPLVIALVLAFIIGHGFMAMVKIFQRFLGNIYRIGRFLWNSFGRKALAPLTRGLSKWKTDRKKPVPLWLIQLNTYAHISTFNPLVRETHRVYRSIAMELLRKYGIERPLHSAGEDWQVWYAVLGKPDPEELRGNVLSIALHASGWCGIVAVQYAPVLKNPHYLGFCSLLIFFGLCHDWWVARRLNHPVGQGLIAVRSVFKELKDASQPKANELQAPSEEKAGSLAIE